MRYLTRLLRIWLFSVMVRTRLRVNAGEFRVTSMPGEQVITQKHGYLMQRHKNESIVYTKLGFCNVKIYQDARLQPWSNNKKRQTEACRFIMARPKGLEPPTFTFGVCYSIRLSYGRSLTNVIVTQTGDGWQILFSIKENLSAPAIRIKAQKQAGPNTQSQAG